MQIDCFVSTFDRTAGRLSWSRETISRYLTEPALRVTVFDAGSVPEQIDWFNSKPLTLVSHPTEGSLFRRFLLAEAYAQSELYLFSDNDVRPLSESWLSKGLELTRKYSNFGYIVYRLQNSDFSGDHGFQNSDLRSIHKGGGLAIVRRDVRTAPFRIPFVADPDHMDDYWYCEAIRKSGSTVGMFEQLYVDHLGRKESS